MRCALYARVSTRDKDQTPETQLVALRQYVEAHGLTVQGEYVDQASARDLRGRTRWRDLLRQAHKGGIDVVLVTRLDRAFRSAKDTYDNLDQLARCNVGFMATTQPIDTTTSTGKLLLGMLAVVAEFEGDLIKDRINEGLARRRGEGKPMGRPPGSKDKKVRKKTGYRIRWDRNRENGAAAASK